MASAPVRDRNHLAQLLREQGGGPHYVYILCKPDGLNSPFYVGIGRGNRLFAHEEEARDSNQTNAKVSVIREIWAAGEDVIRTIESVHSTEPWDREEELISSIGRIADGTGPLTNAQVYAKSAKINGVELRKYAAEHVESGDTNTIPAKFKLAKVRLMAGPNEPHSRTSVFGKIYTVAEQNPGATGEELIQLLHSLDFTGNKSAYTQSGQVSSIWLARYIEGGYFRADRQHLQEFRGSV